MSDDKFTGMPLARAAQPVGKRLSASLLWRSAMAVVATVPLFCLPYNIAVNFLAPPLVLCLTLATIWLMPRLAWALIAIIGIAVAVLFNGITLMVSLLCFGTGSGPRSDSNYHPNFNPKYE